MIAVLPAVGGLLGLGSLVLVVIGAAQRRRDRSTSPLPTGLQLRRRPLTQDDVDTLDLRGLNLQRARIQRLDLSNRDLSDTVLKGAHLEGSSLAGARLAGCDLTWACLRSCDLSGAVFTGALLLEADLRETRLHGADLSATPALDSVRWDGARCDRSTRWPRGFRPTAVGVTVETERSDH